MQLLNKKDATVYEIYDISYNDCGDPLFLIYKDKRWLRVHSMYFTPSYEPAFYNGKDTYLADGELIQDEDRTPSRRKRRLFVDM